MARHHRKQRSIRIVNGIIVPVQVYMRTIIPFNYQTTSTRSHHGNYYNPNLTTQLYATTRQRWQPPVVESRAASPLCPLLPRGEQMTPPCQTPHLPDSRLLLCCRKY